MFHLFLASTINIDIIYVLLNLILLFVFTVAGINVSCRRSLSDQDMGEEMTIYIMQAFLYMMKILSSRFLEVSILSLENFCQLVNMLFFIYMQYPLYCVDLNS